MLIFSLASSWDGDQSTRWGSPVDKGLKVGTSRLVAGEKWRYKLARVIVEVI